MTDCLVSFGSATIIRSYRRCRLPVLCVCVCVIHGEVISLKNLNEIVRKVISNTQTHPSPVGDHHFCGGCCCCVLVPFFFSTPPVGQSTELKPSIDIILFFIHSWEEYFPVHTVPLHTASALSKVSSGIHAHIFRPLRSYTYIYVCLERYQPMYHIRLLPDIGIIIRPQKCSISLV